MEIEDKRIDPASIEKEGGFYEELMPDLGKDDGSARIIFYLEEGASERDSLLKDVQAQLQDLKGQMDIGSGQILVSISDESDWRDNWKTFFHPFSIGDLWIKPTWEVLPEGADPSLVIEIDPGISFGTGQHETTKMCIQWLQSTLHPGNCLLDIGFGSGILSIAALKLGAKEVVGTDIDPDCLESVASNFSVNGLSESLGKFYIGDLTSDAALMKKVGETPYDVVVANILADIVSGLGSRIHTLLKEDGFLIASGIIDFKAEAVKEALSKEGFALVNEETLGEWVSMVFKKRRADV